jgi:hypothetical protein
LFRNGFSDVDWTDLVCNTSQTLLQYGRRRKNSKGRKKGSRRRKIRKRRWAWNRRRRRSY